MKKYTHQQQLCEAVRAKNLLILEDLLRQGADPNVCILDDHEFAPLHDAADVGFIEGMEMLIKAGAIIESQDIHGNHPLNVSAEAGQLEASCWLISHGADLHAKNYYGESALAKALNENHIELANMLLLKGSLNQNDLQEAAAIAICFHREESARWMLDHGISPDMVSKDGFHWLSIVQNERMRGHRAISKMLLDAGAQIDARDRVGQTALHHAVRQKCEHSMTKLLLAGANPDMPDDGGITVRDIITTTSPKSMLEIFVAAESSLKAQKAIRTANELSPIELKLL